jgi:hypothetical protein
MIGNSRRRKMKNLVVALLLTTIFATTGYSAPQQLFGTVLD